MNGGGFFCMRLRGFLRKEYLQIKRDPSSILLALVMPLVLLFLFGYGVSLNPTRVPVAIVAESSAPAVNDLLARFRLSDYFEPRFVASPAAAINLVDRGEVDGFIHIRDDFSRRLSKSGGGSVQVIVNGVDANRSRLIAGYARGAIAKWSTVRRARGELTVGHGVQVASRIRFNESGESRNFLVPGLIALIMTLVGMLLTALVIAREWERGTMEAILVTPLRLRELLLGKLIPYYVLGMLGMLVSVAGGVWMFDVPLRGSFALLFVLSSLFLIASLGFGLAISAAMRSQFIAAQIAILAGFLPAIFLSGMIFDLESTPLVIQWLSHIIPARYFVDISHTLFLAGNVGPVLWPAAGALLSMAVILLLIVRRKLSKRLD